MALSELVVGSIALFSLLFDFVPHFAANVFDLLLGVHLLATLAFAGPGLGGIIVNFHNL